MSKIVVLIISVVILAALFSSAVWASYSGIGFMTIGSGGQSVRSNSVHGPMIIGGGPGHGK